VPFNDLDALEAALRTEDVALFVTEPIVGHGVRLPEPGYLEGAQELCRATGRCSAWTRCATGFGRTGTMFALRALGPRAGHASPSRSPCRAGTCPSGDAVRVARVRRRLRLDGARAQPRLDLRAERPRRRSRGSRCCIELEAEGLVERSAEIGELLLERTRPLVERYGVVQDVRGLGLFWAIEFGEPGGSATWRLLERLQPGIFSSSSSCRSSLTIGC
jgi:ornithine--oxo-acid transaminase